MEGKQVALAPPQDRYDFYWSPEGLAVGREFQGFIRLLLEDGAWGTDINISDPAPALTTPTAPDPSNTLSPTFQQLIVDLANDTCTTPTLVPTITTSSGTSILH